MSWMLKPRCLDENGHLDQQHLKLLDVRCWTVSTLGRSKDLATYRNDNGAATLQDMAWRSVMMHIDMLHFETLKLVPWHAAERLWKLLEKHDLVSIAIWQKFHLSHGENIREHKPKSLMVHHDALRFMAHNNQGRGADNNFELFLEQLAAPAFEWLNVMSFYDAALAKTDWISLAKLPNIGSLQINWYFSDPRESSMNETVIKAWARAAQEGQAFQKLKFLAFREFPNLRTHILLQLQQLPALRMLYLSANRITCKTMEHEARTPMHDGIWDCDSPLCRHLGFVKYNTDTASHHLNQVYQRILAYDEGDGQAGAIEPLLKTKMGPTSLTMNWVVNYEVWLERRQSTNRPNPFEQQTNAMESSQTELHRASKKPKLKRQAMQSMSDLLSTMQ